MRSLLSFWSAICALTVLIGGCAAVQNTENTVEMADSIARIRTTQILRNLSNAIADPSAVPSQIVLATGQANVSAGLSPSLKATSLTHSAAALELDNTITDTWTAQWQFTSVTDATDLRLLRNLYALVIAKTLSDKDDFFTAQFALDGGLSAADKAAGSKTPSARAADVKNYVKTGDSADCKKYQASHKPSNGLPFKRWLYWRNNGGTWMPEDPDASRADGADGDGSKDTQTWLGLYGDYEIETTSTACFNDFIVLVQELTPKANVVSEKGPQVNLQ